MIIIRPYYYYYDCHIFTLYWCDTISFAWRLTGLFAMHCKFVTGVGIS